jgi:hypothetical protein
MSQQADALNPAIASWFQIGSYWRGVTDPERWALAAKLHRKG